MNARVGAFLASPLLACVGVAIAASPPYQPRFHLANFSAPLVIDNPYLPLQPGTRTVLYELEDGECHVNDVVVARAIKHDFVGDYAGIATRVVRDRVWADDACDGTRGVLLEDTVDWAAQDDHGNVWYFGERTVEYEYDDAGHRISASTEGSWEAGRRGAKAGFLMVAHPTVGMYFRQEYEAGVAEDTARIVQVGIRYATRLGRFHDCIETRETTALTPGDVEYKIYCRNLGTVREIAPGVHGGAELVNFGLH